MSLGETVARRRVDPLFAQCSQGHSSASGLDRAQLHKERRFVGGRRWVVGFVPAFAYRSFFLVAAIKIGCFCCPGAEACACTVICRRIPTGTDRILLSLKFPSIWPVRTISPSWRANSGNYRSHGPVRSPRRPPGWTHPAEHSGELRTAPCSFRIS